jgi:leader peptidase (prepilin peptidase)/N-methyltransferase
MNNLMNDWLALGCLVGALALLVALSLIDLKTRLLPNKLVAPFALLGIIFHIITNWAYLSPFQLLLGALLGAGILYGIRFTANWIYQQDTLGLGDVKLLGAAGLWLGPDGVLMALIIGAMAGLLHGLAVALWQTLRHRKKFNLSRLEVPAGPGFAIGIIAVGLYLFSPFGSGH